ncbi:hypothetical protein [Gemmiger sp.]
MKIICEFESYKEFLDFANGGAEKELIKIMVGQPAEAAAPVPAEAPKKAEKPAPKKKEAVKEPEAVPQAGDWTPGGGSADDSIVNPSTGKTYEEEAAEEDPAPAEPEQKIDESFRVQVRKTLATLNKKTGKNTASELIHGFGVDKLTEVALEDLPALMQKAEEALNA